MLLNKLFLACSFLWLLRSGVLKTRLKVLNRADFSEAEEILEICQNALDDLWKLEDYVYPQKRMTHLVNDPPLKHHFYTSGN